MMARALPLLAVAALACAGCPPAVGGPGDPRLGTPIFHVEGFALAHARAVVQHPDGRVFIAAGHTLARDFGVNVARAPETHVFVVDAEDVVTELPPLPEPLGLGLNDTLLSPTVDGVAVGVADEPVGGRALHLYVLEDGAWASRTLFASDRPANIEDDKAVGAVQVRAFSADQILVAAWDTVFSWSASEGRFVQLALPAGLVDVRLGPRDDDAVALIGVDTAGTPLVQRLARGTWEPEGGPIALPVVASLDCFSLSGTPDAMTFTLTIGGACTLARVRDGGGFVGDPVPAEGGSPAILRAAARDPHRALLLRGRHPVTETIEVFGAWDGRDAGALGAIQSFSPVTCDACTVDERTGHATGADCSARCLPRNVEVVDLEPTVATDGLLALVLDVFPSGLTFSLKRLPLPIPSSVADEPAPDPDAVPNGPLPPIDDIEPTTAVVSVTAMVAGRASHVGTTVTMTTEDGSTLEGTTDGAGLVTFQPIAPGPVTLTAVNGALAASAELDASAGGTFSTTLVLVLAGISFVSTDAEADDVVIGAVGGPVLSDAGVVSAYDVQTGARIAVAAALGPTPPLRRENATSSLSDALYLNDGPALVRVIRELDGQGNAVTIAERLAEDFPLNRVGFRVGIPVYGERQGAADADVIDLFEKPAAADAPRLVDTGASHSVYSSGIDRCFQRWTWKKNPDTSFTVFREQSAANANCEASATGAQITGAPLLFEPQAEVQGATVFGFESAACGRAASWATPCTLWRVTGVAASVDSTRALAFLPHGGGVRLEAGAAPGDPRTLRRNGALVQDPLDWDPNLQPGEQALVENFAGNRMFWRGVAGVYTDDQGAAPPVLAVAGAVKMLPVPEGGPVRALVWAAGDGDPQCGDGCELWSLADNGVATQLASDVGPAAVLVDAGDIGSVVYEQVWSGCPGGPCSAVMMVRASGGVPTEPAPIAVGALSPMVPELSLADAAVVVGLDDVVRFTWAAGWP